MRKEPPPPKCWKYELAGGWIVLAGKTDADNDALSLRIARPEDWWFHVHGCPGSHVILQHPDGLEPDRELLKVAAAVAAWHSKARQAGNVPVTVTKAKHVGKPCGWNPGQVSVCRDITLKVRPGLPETKGSEGLGGVRV